MPRTGILRAARPTAAAAALAGATLLPAACGSPAQPAAGHATQAPAPAPAARHTTRAPAPSPAPAASSACPASGLSASVGASGAAAGTSYLPIDLANESGDTCLMDGFPAVWFTASEHGRRVGPAAVPDASQGGGRRVTVGAGDSAHFWLEVPTAQDWSASSCHPVTAHWLRVVPPGGTAPLHVPLHVRLPYGVAVCTATASRFRLAVMPVRSGRGIVGHTP